MRWLIAAFIVPAAFAASHVRASLPGPDAPHPASLARPHVALMLPDGYSPGQAGEHVEATPTVVASTPRHRPARVAQPDTSLIDRAQKHLGGNPTGWSSLWCARFMAMIAPGIAKKVRNPNLARSWAKLPKVKPRPGAIVVLSRGGNPQAGHIGVVKGFDRQGNPVVISGNHNRKVAIATYPKHRVIAYVGR